MFAIIGIVNRIGIDQTLANALFMGVVAILMLAAGINPIYHNPLGTEATSPSHRMPGVDANPSAAGPNRP